jgi:O-methyltransferase
LYGVRLARPAALLAAATAALAIAIPVVASASQAMSAGQLDPLVHQVNLASDVPGLAPLLDPDLKNPWGAALTPISPLWVANQGTGSSTVYSLAPGAGKVAKSKKVRVTIPAPPTGPALHKDMPGSMRGFALSLPAEGHWRPWGQLLEAVRTGKHQAPATLGRELFDYYSTAPEEAAAFTAGLAGMTSVAGAEAARVIDTADARLAVDVGGASGDLLHDLMKVNPKLRGVVFDLPHVAPDALAAATKAGLADRLEVEGGDFLEAVPADGDLYLLRYILHDWDDDNCVRILRNCRKAMAPGARVVVLEMILGAVGAEPFAVPSQDLNMLVMLGGRERTVAQFDDLFSAAGLRRATVASTQSPMGVIEAVVG